MDDPRAAVPPLLLHAVTATCMYARYVYVQYVRVQHPMESRIWVSVTDSADSADNATETAPG